MAIKKLGDKNQFTTYVHTFELGTPIQVGLASVKNL